MLTLTLALIVVYWPGPMYGSNSASMSTNLGKTDLGIVIVSVPDIEAVPNDATKSLSIKSTTTDESEDEDCSRIFTVLPNVGSPVVTVVLTDKLYVSLRSKSVAD